MMPSPATVRVLFVACLVAVLGTAAAQYDTGALVGTDSFYNQVCVWNTSSADSYQCGCTDELQETFTPAYVTNTATRELVYLKALSDDSVVDSVYTMPLNIVNGTVGCGMPTKMCDAHDWHTNQTMRIFSDPSINQTIMVDTKYITDRFYKIRIWKFSLEDCSLVFVDEFKTSPIDEMETGSFSYDPSNHRLYATYIDIHRDTRYRLRSVSVDSATLNYDMTVPMQSNHSNTVFSQFDPTSGKVIIISGPYDYDKGSLQGYLVDPIHFDTLAPSTWKAGRFEVGPGTQNLVVNWVERLLVSQRPNSNGYQQTCFDTDSGTVEYQWTFTDYVDNGWYYDPFTQVVPVDVNTASAEELAAGLPGVSSSVAQNIVNCRNLDGRYPTVDAVFDRVPQVSQDLYEGFRPYAHV